MRPSSFFRAAHSAWGDWGCSLGFPSTMYGLKTRRADAQTRASWGIGWLCGSRSTLSILGGEALQRTVLA